MKYKNLGNTGLYVSELTLGTMTFDKEGGSFAGLIGATGQESGGGFNFMSRLPGISARQG